LISNRNRVVSYRAVAVFEALKGVLVLIAAGLLFHVLHGDVQSAAEDLVRHFHLNPARHNPRIFIESVLNFGNAHHLALSLGAIVYAAIRFAEAYGLWRGMNWAWGFGIASAGLYIPFELVELAKRVTWAGLVVIGVNALILAVLWHGRPRQE
jgi:uncharacterized membrane protein (DUF2068 family)